MPAVTPNIARLRVAARLKARGGVLSAGLWSGRRLMSLAFATNLRPSLARL